MALGLFGSLLIGVIFDTLGTQTANLFGDNAVSAFCVEIGGIAKTYMGAAIGVAVAWSLKAPPLVLFTSVVIGMMGATMTGFGIDVAGGPAGAFVAVTLIMGGIGAKLIGPAIGWCMLKLGDLIMTATEWQPFLFGIVISVVVGLALTAPISSAALCIMLDLSGLAAGAATVGCCAQMVGFAVASYKENGVGGLVAQGLGTSMLQISNIIKNPWILLPATLAGAIVGPISTCLLKMTNIPVGAGMGTSGLVGQIGTFTDMGFTLDTLWKVLLIQIVLPAVLTILIDQVLRRTGKIKDGDYKLDL